MALPQDRGTRMLLALLATLLFTRGHAQSITASAALPIITDSDFIGYTSDGSSWSAQFCPMNSIWYQTSSWARCCPTSESLSNCAIWTTCLDQSVIIQRGGANATCDQYNPICRTAYLSQDGEDNNPFIYVGCGTANWTAFRTPPVAVVQTLTEIATATESGDVPSTTAGGSQTASNTNPAPSQTGESGGGSSSKVWIVGAVLGPVAALVIAGLLFYIWKLKKSKQADPSAAPMMGQQPAFAAHQGQTYYPQQGAPYQNYQQPYNQDHAGYYGQQVPKQYYGQDAGGYFAPAEMTGESRPVEAPTHPASPHNYGPGEGSAR